MKKRLNAFGNEIKKAPKMSVNEKRILCEEWAVSYLVAKGYKILLKCYECEIGTVDLIAKDSGHLVFVAVNREEFSGFLKTMAYYLKRYAIKDVPTRIDLITVKLLKDGEPIITIKKGE